MKKLISVFTCVCAFLLICTSYAVKPQSKQTASAWLTEDNKEIYATVDVSDGYSVEFASGAIYIYDQEISNNTEVLAICITLSEEAYNDHIKEAKNSKISNKVNDAIYYEQQNTANYLFVQEGVYMMLSVYDRSKADDIFNRLTFSTQ